MLGSAAPATATLHTSTSSATPTSPTRPSRLRGLSYLRSYTHNHLHSRTDSGTPPLTRSTSSTNFDTISPTVSPREQTHQRAREAESTIQSGENGWLPTVQGRSGLSRDSLHPTSTTEPASPERSSNIGMTRSRAASAFGPTPTTTASASRSALRRQGRSETMPDINQNHATAGGLQEPSNTGSNKEPMPTIRFIPHLETRSSRPSLHFTTLSRTLKNHTSVVRVGRYSERDNNSQAANPHSTSITPVGFKSKVVSRRHCEFWCTNGQWYVKDVKSSSGTFLNHVRLSPPGMESRPYPVNDGDVVQLGIDFKGGEEVIFRCVKIRIECNRGWQKSLNSFNTSAHKKLFKNTKAGRDSDAASTNSSECSICLNPVAPCQALFVAPCSHVWHYRCVRNLIHGPSWPNFLCPNCRFVADLDADVEQPEEEEFFDEEQAGECAEEEESSEDRGPTPDDEDEDDDEQQQQTIHETRQDITMSDHQLATSTSASFSTRRRGGNSEHSSNSPQSTATSRPVNIITRGPSHRHHERTPSSDLLSARSATPTSNAQFALAAGVMSMSVSDRNRDREQDDRDNLDRGLDRGPMTPRNDAGPFVFDGLGEQGREQGRDDDEEAVGLAS